MMTLRQMASSPAEVPSTVAWARADIGEARGKQELFLLNSPFASPPRHWELDESGQPTQKILETRRRAEFITPIPKPKKRKNADGQGEIPFNEGKKLPQYDVTSIINEVRGHVDTWRSLPNPNQWQVTPETARLLQHWRHHAFATFRTLFSWTMSDFSLMDAIECGIVKLPRVPVAENIPGDEMPMFRNLADQRADYGFCPSCLIGAAPAWVPPYIPVEWACAVVTHCPSHQTRLLERCPACYAKDPFLIGIGEHPDRAECWQCEAPLGLSAWPAD
jgi:hypothetical protein